MNFLIFFLKNMEICQMIWYNIWAKPVWIFKVPGGCFSKADFCGCFIGMVGT